MTKAPQAGPLPYLQAEAGVGILGARFLLASGRAFSDLQLDHSYGVGTPQACFSNALQLALQHPEDLVYCEGRATAQYLPVEHAWCITRDGRVIDTTWRDDDLKGALYFGTCFDTTWLAKWLPQRQHLAVLAEFFPQDLLHADPAVFLAEPSPSQLAATRQMQTAALQQLAELSA